MYGADKMEKMRSLKKKLLTLSPTKNPGLPGAKIVISAAQAAVNQKALDVRALDVRGVTDVADYFVIISGTSDRHVKGIVDKIEIALKSLGESPAAVSGYESGEWVLLDFGDVLVHVFYEPLRQYYDLDGFWSEAKVVALPDDLENQIRKFRTGIYPT